MELHRLVQSPRLWIAGDDVHRRVTWMELFFDLIFVAAVAEVGAPLAADYSLSGLVRYAFLFVLIWWAWSGHTLYSTRFDHDDLPQCLLILLQCFIAAVMAANAKEALDSRSSAGFGAAYAGIRIVLVVQYLRARRVPDTRGLTTRYAIGFGVAAALWIVSAFLEAPARYWVWALALAVDFATPWLAVKHSMRFPPDGAHFPERFGLFTIILLGEFIASVMRGIESQEYWSFTAAATAFSSMGFAFVLRWWYFDVAQSASERHIRSKRQAALFQIWHYAHLPLFLGIGVAGAGFQRMISLDGEEHLKPSEAWGLCLPGFPLMGAPALVGSTPQGAPRRGTQSRYIWAHCLIVGLTMVIGIMGAGWSRVVVVLGLVAVCATQTLIGRKGLLAPTLVARKAS